MSVSMALLVARRLALMRDHSAALRPVREKMREVSGAVGGAARDVVLESAIYLLAIEVSAMLWLVGGWSSLVALRFRCFFPSPFGIVPEKLELSEGSVPVLLIQGFVKPCPRRLSHAQLVFMPS